MASRITATMRAVMEFVAQQMHPKPIAFDAVFVGLGDRFDDDRRRVHRTLLRS